MESHYLDTLLCCDCNVLWEKSIQVCVFALPPFPLSCFLSVATDLPGFLISTPPRILEASSNDVWINVSDSLFLSIGRSMMSPSSQMSTLVVLKSCRHQPVSHVTLDSDRCRRTCVVVTKSGPICHTRNCSLSQKDVKFKHDDSLIRRIVSTHNAQELRVSK